MKVSNNFKIIILVNIVIFLLINLIFKDQAREASYLYFGVEKSLVLDYNQFYRLITYSFVHADIFHVALNMVALGSLSSAVIYFTSEKFSIIVYFIASIVSGIGIVLFTNELTIGASGAVYSLFGIIIYYSLKRYMNGDKELIKSLLPTLLINAYISFTENVSLTGHLGGLVVGLIASFIYDKYFSKKYF